MASVDPREETLRLLRSIDATMRAMLLVMSEKRNDAPAVNDSVCNGPHGDPVIKAKDPRDWSGPPMTGRKFSECPPEYLDMLADRYDYFATKDEDATKQRYAKMDAARARGWAARLRAGWTAPTPAPQGGFSDEPADF
jgi:hypothetical protein